MIGLWWRWLLLFPTCQCFTLAHTERLVLKGVRLQRTPLVHCWQSLVLWPWCEPASVGVYLLCPFAFFHRLDRREPLEQYHLFIHRSPSTFWKRLPPPPAHLPTSLVNTAALSAVTNILNTAEKLDMDGVDKSSKHRQHRTLSQTVIIPRLLNVALGMFLLRPNWK